MTSRKKTGRPANPYTSQPLFGEPGWSHHYFDNFYCDENGDIAADVPPHAPSGTSVEALIQGLLVQAGPVGHMNLALPRTVIEATLNVDHYTDPRAITNALKRLCSHKEQRPLLQVYRTQLPIAGQKTPSDIYSIGRLPYESELETLRKLIEQRGQDFDPRLKGKCAEHYVWSLLRHSGRFILHQKRKCGNIADPERKNRLDILAIDEAMGTRLGISIKNERQWFHAGSRAIRDAYAKAQAHEARPMLVAPHLTPEAKARCKRDGIIFFELGRQLLPAELPDGRHLRLIVETLRPILGPQRFEFIPKQFPRPGARSEAVQRDIEFVKALKT